jgi:hypothetical protein
MAGAVKGRKMNMSLNYCQALLKHMLLFIFTALMNVMNRRFELEISAV